MKSFINLFLCAGAAVAPAIFFVFGTSAPEKLSKEQVHKAPTRKIQAAILLDVSGSMDGLIEQAKSQLWNMVSVMGKTKCGTGEQPQIEIALYEYGRTTNDVKGGYVKQISPFTADLDKLSKDLFSLKTNGGDEYCGQVIFTSLNELKWDPSKENYKVIFIAGNEDFLQGNMPYTKACNLAKQNGVIVNTIYCGDKMQGISEHWNLNAECGEGSFTNIDQNEKAEEIPTPYDSMIYTLNKKLNATYIGYGAEGRAKAEVQSEMDSQNYMVSKSAGLKRAEVKGKASLYNNSGWDLIDAAKDDAAIADKVDMKSLPDSLQNKSRAELKAVVAQKAQERGAVQKEMAGIAEKRSAFLVEERKKKAGATNTATLETVMEKIIREQAKRYDMTVE